MYSLTSTLYKAMFCTLYLVWNKTVLSHETFILLPGLKQFSKLTDQSIPATLAYVYTGPVPNGSGRIFGPERPSVYTGPFWKRSRNGSKTGPAILQVQLWISSGPVPERSRVNTWIGPKRFHVNRSWSVPVPWKRSLSLLRRRCLVTQRYLPHNLSWGIQQNKPYLKSIIWLYFYLNSQAY